MTAALLARRMIADLTDTARGELDETLAALAQEGHVDLVRVFEALLDGKDLVSALSLPEGTVDLLYAQAHARFNADRIPDALALFQALILLAPGVKDHWLGLGVCLLAIDNPGAAELALLSALEIAPDCPAVTYHLAELEVARGRFAEADRMLGRFAALEESVLKQRMTPGARRLGAIVAERTGP